jgi:hypothetical protein
MRKLYVVVAVIIVAVLVDTAFFFSGKNVDPRALKHETNRWAVIEDINGDQIAVETVRNETWAELVQLRQNGSRLWVGSFVEEYDNLWGFRFSPGNLTVAEVTAEGLQANIKYIKANLANWMGQLAYVSARVVDVHSP